MIERRIEQKCLNPHCNKIGFIYRKDDFLICTMCGNEYEAKRKDDIKIRSLRELKQEFNGGA